MSSAARIEELQKKFDENPRRYFAPLANECRKAGDLDAAIAICRTHLPQQPGHMSGHIVYGQALFESGELDEARTVFETALGLDPENLIALRHMGDIAARHGDLTGARQWYVRVLETDPRNEEIQSLVAGLDTGGGDFGAGDDAPRVRGGLPSLVDPELLAVAAEAMPEEAVPEPGVVEIDELALAGLDVGPLVTSETEAAAAADTPRDELLEPTALEFEAPAAAAGTLEGLEATTFEVPPADEVSSYERVGDEALLDDVEAPTAALEGLESAEFDASGYGDTGLESIAAPSFEFEPVDAAPMQDPPVAAPPSGEAFATETMAELYLRQGYRDEALGVYRKLVNQSPDDAALRSRMERLEAELEADPAMGREAEVEALEADGDDVIAGLPRAIDPALIAVAADTVADAPVAPAPASSGGPTIRQFLASLATGSPLALHQPAGEIAEVVDLGDFEVTDAAADVSDTAADVPYDAADVTEPQSLELEPEADEPPAPPPAADPGPSRGEGLDALFGAAASEDARAADTLAAAYRPAEASAPPAATEPEADPLRGKPARPAGNDLSLDHVFGAPRQQGAPRHTGSFSFDQFFAEGAVKPAREETPEQPAVTGDEEDLEQFNSWLHNLRKP